MCDTLNGPPTIPPRLAIPIVLLLVSIVAPPDLCSAGCPDVDADGFCEDVDCDDGNADVYPGALEICDGLNNDCDQVEWPSLIDGWSEEGIGSASWTETVFAADLDGDDDLDVLSASHHSGWIRWFENTTGDGSAWTSHGFPTAGDYTYSVFAADLDHDGDLDILAAFENEYDIEPDIAWYENTEGDGSEWTEHVIYALGYGALSVVAGDIDGDLDLDVVYGGPSSTAWLENTAGDGSTWTRHVISTVGWPFSVFVADIDGDLDGDVLAASGNHILWHENTTGNGSAWNKQVISVTADGAQSVTAADIDGDLDLDVLSASFDDDRIAWYTNSAGDGSAWIEHTISATANGARAVFAVDLDDDSDIDVLSASQYDDEFVWHENSAMDGSVWTTHVISSTAEWGSAIFAADIDGDNELEVLSASRRDGKIALYEPSHLEQDDDGDGWAECEGDCDDRVPTCLTDCTDLDDDGVALCAGDCDESDPASHPGATENCDGNDNVCSGWVSGDEIDHDGDGYVECTGWADTQGDQPSVLGGGDCDDTNTDVYAGAPQICDGLNNDCGSIGWPSLIDDWSDDTISLSASGAWSVIAADVDGDDDLDALSASRYYNEISWYDNLHGDGSAWAEHVISTSAASARSVFAADVDADLDIDVLSASANDSKIAWYENSLGNGSAWTEHVISTTVSDARTVFAADVDGDLDLDVLAASHSLAVRIVWFENTAGDGSAWTEHLISTNGAHAFSVFAVDLDGDLDIDVLSAPDTGVAWYENTVGDGSAWIEHAISPAADWITSIFAADVDGDVDLDVLSANEYSGEIIWYENTTGNASAWIERVISTSADGPLAVVAADVDGDRDTDILSAATYGDEIAWYQNIAGDGSVWTEGVILEDSDGASSVFVADMDGDDNLDVLSAAIYDKRIAWHSYGALEGDHDGDEIGECDGDCDDANPDTHPGAPETNDGLDNQCPGDIGHGLIDEIDGTCGFHDPVDENEFSWTAQPAATLYEVARSEDLAFITDCLVTETPEAYWIDDQPVPPAVCFHYLVRATQPHAGSWGATSTGVERLPVCP